MHRSSMKSWRAELDTALRTGRPSIVSDISNVFGPWLSWKGSWGILYSRTYCMTQFYVHETSDGALLKETRNTIYT